MNGDDLRKLASSLPEYPGLLGRESYTNAAVVVLLVQIGGEYHFVLQKRSATIVQGSEVCFPGGVFDPHHDQSLRDTALREMHEELGVQPGNILLYGFLGMAIALRGIAVDCFLAELKGNSIDGMVIDTREVERVFTIPVAWFRNHEPGKYFIRMTLHPDETPDGKSEKILFPARELGLPERYWDTWDGGRRPVLYYDTGEEKIWGLTAQIIFSMIAMI